MKIAIIVLCVAALGGGFWYYTTVMQKPAAGQAEASKDGEDATNRSKDVVVVDKNKTEIFKLKDKIQINVFDAKGASYIVVAKISFEVSNKKAVDELEKQEAKVADIVNQVFSSKSYEDITVNDRDHSLLKADLKTKVDALLSDGRLISVLFESFVYQSLH